MCSMAAPKNPALDTAGTKTASHSEIPKVSAFYLSGASLPTPSKHNIGVIVLDNVIV